MRVIGLVILATSLALAPVLVRVAAFG